MVSEVVVVYQLIVGLSNHQIQEDNLLDNGQIQLEDHSVQLLRHQGLVDHDQAHLEDQFLIQVQQLLHLKLHFQVALLPQVHHVQGQQQVHQEDLSLQRSHQDPRLVQLPALQEDHSKVHLPQQPLVQVEDHSRIHLLQHHSHSALFQLQARHPTGLIQECHSNRPLHLRPLHQVVDQVSAANQTDLVIELRLKSLVVQSNLAALNLETSCQEVKVVKVVNRQLFL